MKTKILLLISAIFLFYSCKKDTVENIEVVDVYGDPQLKLDEYKEIIGSSSSGWEFYLSNEDNENFNYGYLNFNKENSSDFLTTYNRSFSKYDTTSYRLGVINSNPSLVFPRGSKFNTFTQLVGSTDTLYTIKKYENDTLYLQGEYKKSILKLFKSDAQNVSLLKDDFYNKNFSSIKQLLTLPKFFFTATIGGSNYDFLIDTNSNYIDMKYGTIQEVKNIRSKFVVVANGLKLLHPFNESTLNIKGLTNLSYTGSSLVFTEGSITNSSTPVLYDQNAANDFLTNAPTTWISYLGFSNRNTTDIAKLAAVPGYLYLVYWPKYASSGATVYDRLGFFTNINNGSWAAGSQAPVSSVTADKLVKISSWGNFGNITSQAVYDATVATINYLYNSRGFYAIKSGDGYYLVDARDALTWMYLESE